MKFEKKSLEEISKMTAEEKETYFAAKETHDADLRKKEMDSAVEKALEPILKGQTDTAKDIEDLAENVNILTAKLQGGMTDDLKGYLHEVIKENHAAIVEAVKNKKEIKFEVTKVAAMHMTNNGTITNVSGLSYPTNPNFLVDNNIAVIRVPENFILSVIPNRQKDKVPQQILKRQQLPKEGDIAVTAEGAVKPLVQYLFQNTATTRQKYAGRIEWTEEFAMDFEELFAEIVRMFERDVLTKWQEGIFTIVDTNATAYVGSVLDDTIPNPDNGLAIVAAGLQIESLNYNVTTVIMNPQDVASAVYTQDQNGNFSIKPYVDAAGNVIGGGYRLIKSNKVPVGTAYVGDFGIYQEIHSGFIFRIGQYNAQFIENEYTGIGEVFSIVNAAPIDYKGIVKINLATVKAALLKP